MALIIVILVLLALIILLYEVRDVTNKRKARTASLTTNESRSDLYDVVEEPVNSTTEEPMKDERELRVDEMMNFVNERKMSHGA